MAFWDLLFGKRQQQDEIPDDVKRVFEQFKAILNDDATQTAAMPEILQEHLRPGASIDKSVTRNINFGRIPTLPIPVNGWLGEITYLSKLKVKSSGSGIFFHRLGSIEQMQIGNNLDVYEIVSWDGTFWDIMYFDFYYTEKIKVPPRNYVFADKLVGLTGINQCIPNFPVGIYDATRIVAKQIFGGIPLADPRMKHIDTSSFQRPSNFQKEIYAIKNQLASSATIEQPINTGDHKTASSTSVPRKEASSSSGNDTAHFMVYDEKTGKRYSEFRYRGANDFEIFPQGYGDFGTTVTNPIPTCGVTGSDEYLAHLRAYGGVEILTERVGSVRADNIQEIIDCYNVFIKRTRMPLCELYLCPYSKKTSSLSPKGFVLVDFHPKGWEDVKPQTDKTSQSTKKPFYDIQMDEPRLDFGICWQDAIEYVDSKAGDTISWLKSVLQPPFLEHFSFLLGNQLFFIRLEDVDNSIEIPGTFSNLLRVADNCKGHPCIMRMKCADGKWIPVSSGWGFSHARTGQEIYPPSLVSGVQIEMTDWELHGFAVQIVRENLKGRQIMSWSSDPEIDPSMWFVGDTGPEWIVVREVRYPITRAKKPKNLTDIAANCAKMAKKGYFASVSFANTENIDLPLYRGKGCSVHYTGLEEVNIA